MRKLYVQDVIYEQNDWVDWNEFTADQFVQVIDEIRVVSYKGLLLIFDITADDMGNIYLSSPETDGDGEYYLIGDEEVL